METLFMASGYEGVFMNRNVGTMSVDCCLQGYNRLVAMDCLLDLV